MHEPYYNKTDTMADNMPKSDPEFKLFPEGRKHVNQDIDANEKELRQNKGMGKVGRTDDTASGKAT